MHRRDIARTIFAAAGATMLSKTADAQGSCAASCYPQTAAESAAGIIPTNTSYPPGDVRRYGGVGNGLNDDTLAVQRAHDQGKQPTGIRPHLPTGSWKITSPINPCQLGMYGDGSKFSLLKCSGCHAFQIPANAGWDRPAAVFERFGVDSLANSCDRKFAFYFPGVAAGASVIYNSGFTVRDLEIGRNGRMGGGFYLKDLFRANIENIGLTSVSRMIQVVGSVVQCKCRNVTSNNDNPGIALNQYGVSTESATYASGVGVCENVVFSDCAYIRGSRGIDHQAGSHVEFLNFDTETNHYGAVINAECYVRGGIFAPSATASSWVGVYRGPNIPVSWDGTIFDSVDINTLNAPSAPAQSYGFEIGDGVSPIFGLIIRSCRIRGTPGSMADGIRSRLLRDGTISDNFFENACFVGTAMNLHGRRLFVKRNRVPGGTISVQDAGDTASGGEVTYNECTTLITSFSVPSRWTVVNI